MHIMQKIISYIKGSEFSIFDISGWNPNVTLELGFAMAVNDNWYISYNPNHTPTNEVPSDIRGIDRIQYQSLTEYGEKLTALVAQRFPRSSRASPIADYIAQLQDSIILLLHKNPGMKMAEIAEVLEVNVSVAQVALRPLLAEKIRSTGAKKGTRYFLV